MDPELALYQGLLGLDVASSIELISRGPAVEQNVAVNQIAGTDKPSPEQFLGIGAGLAGAGALGWDKLPDWAKAGLIAAEGGFALQNIRHRNDPSLRGKPFDVPTALLGALGAEGLRRLVKGSGATENLSAAPAVVLGAPGVAVNLNF